MPWNGVFVNCGERGLTLQSPPLLDHWGATPKESNKEGQCFALLNFERGELTSTKDIHSSWKMTFKEKCSGLPEVSSV